MVLFPLVAGTMVSLIVFVMAMIHFGFCSRESNSADVFHLLREPMIIVVIMWNLILSKLPHPGLAKLPRIAYLISGTKGDIQRMTRTLQVLYLSRNQYLLHSDLEAPPRERLELTKYVKMELIFVVLSQYNFLTYGPGSLLGNF